ncbi:hypothetical protein P20311_1745 [Pseudoalteromonas sp. BSi20311]|nr:hypothetical protein P20311_1745 [Pseudoalteromonas sp. BSi20311]
MTALGASVLILGFGWGVKLQPAKFNNSKGNKRRMVAIL